MRRALVAAVLCVVAVTTGCSDDAPPPATPTPTEALWNPCDGLQVGQVSQQLHVDLTVKTGSAQAPQCSFTPSNDGDPAIDVNYQLYPGTLDELFDDFGEITGKTQTLDLPQADDARIVASVGGRERTLAVTGFVQNGDLVQLINAIDPAPYARGRLERTVRSMMRDLATHADESGLSGD